METILKIIKYQLRDVLRSKWLIAYLLFFLLLTYGLFRFAGDDSRVIISLMNVVLIIIPLVSCIYGTIYFYNSKEFILFMLSQPIERSTLYTGMWLSIAISLSVSFIIGITVPYLLLGQVNVQNLYTFALLAASGILLTFIFSSAAFLVAVTNSDKARGFGISLLLWLFYAVVFDGIILFTMISFNDYPLETPALIATLLNPIDSARVLILLKLDISALMGYTGAVFQKFFGNMLGILIAIFSLILWIALPFVTGLKLFKGKDL
jgi:Cu-processing system permease protein